MFGFSKLLMTLVIYSNNSLLQNLQILALAFIVSAQYGHSLVSSVLHLLLTFLGALTKVNSFEGNNSVKISYASDEKNNFFTKLHFLNSKIVWPFSFVNE